MLPKFAGWEGGKALRAPAQDSHRLDLNWIIKAQQILSLSGAQSLAHFPTCKLPLAILTFHTRRIVRRPLPSRISGGLDEA
jgi:hypothetical protein